MFDDRARFRMHHPIPEPPPLIAAPAGEPDAALAQRIAESYRRTQVPEAGPVWEPLLRERQGRFQAWLAQGKTDAVSRELADLGRSEVAHGFFGGAGQHQKVAADRSFAQLLAAWTYDKLLSLAEALGIVRLEMPEAGAWGDTIRLPAHRLWSAIQDYLETDLSPPHHVGGYLGIDAGGQIVQLRVIEAIYAAVRLRQIAEQRGYRHVCEIGAGAGLTGYYAVLLGMERYTIIDLPTLNAVQGYMLAGSRLKDRVALFGEPDQGCAIRILPPEAFPGLAPAAADILYNQDSFPEIEHGAATGYIRDAARLGIPFLLSINQEAHLKAGEGRQHSVPELVAAAGGYRRTSRFRHWLRQGYVEETFELDASPAA